MRLSSLQSTRSRGADLLGVPMPSRSSRPFPHQNPSRDDYDPSRWVRTGRLSAQQLKPSSLARSSRTDDDSSPLRSAAEGGASRERRSWTAPVVSYPEAARLLGCSVRQIQKLVAGGRLQGPPRVGRSPRLFTASLETFVSPPVTASRQTKVAQPLNIPSGTGDGSSRKDHLRMPADFEARLSAVRATRVPRQLSNTRAHGVDRRAQNATSPSTKP
jgi:excisionase family DNA binding protein